MRCGDAVLPEKVLEARTKLRCGLEGPRNVNSGNYSGTYMAMGIDDTLDLERWKHDLKIKIFSYEEDKLVFNLKNVDVSIANALRRIMIAEVPTMAVETVQVYQNTGVIQDEVLALRIGLVPFRLDPDKYHFRREEDDLSSSNSVRFKLHVACTERDLAMSGLSSKPVYSGDLVWEPLTAEEVALSTRAARAKSRRDRLSTRRSNNSPDRDGTSGTVVGGGGEEGEDVEMDETDKESEAAFDALPRPVQDDILLTKLRPGQEIELFVYCEKGIGQTHAKWSPVCPASYRLQPIFEFPAGPLKGEEAEELVNLCPMKVFDIEDTATDAEAGGTGGGAMAVDTDPSVPVPVAVARRPLNCTTCRACLERFPNQIKLLKEKSNSIFTIHSSGCIPPTQIFKTAIAILKAKAAKLRSNLNAGSARAQ